MNVRSLNFVTNGAKTLGMYVKMKFDTIGDKLEDRHRDKSISGGIPSSTKLFVWGLNPRPQD